MDQESVLKIAKTYADKVRKTLDVEQIYLYGSYANNTANLLSDIDIAVVVENIDGDYLDTLTRLYKLRRDVDFRIEPVMLSNKQDISGFLASIIATGKPL
ncbi:MAG: nucleotidyltransferase domain-containing protein [Clostridiales bacterium]|jgi:predicted nucleotidyltransferase|nr:nucleotidyltransferase domain-containing protein [Clostridiales bacterium]MDD2572444.1 nucleotidyltransferase domain-containing protein [Eubacteriales bacterium]MDD3540646.1 nucleotidyltransferase domain-containing protein [Eubacteriales bacterium]MDD4187038.1 nucleotidyltransferase domain-containing protein [Eubacteriales bacterium]MDY0120185.1 nucleotidyltransferase domain-containing protein [Clostridia bacterium]